MLACSSNIGAARLVRFDSPPGSIGIRCTCHRVPPWFCLLNPMATMRSAHAVGVRAGGHAGMCHRSEQQHGAS
eukprot:15457892-Alexandrium_andersonii.AAC.1